MPIILTLLVALILMILVIQSWRERQYNLSDKTVLLTGGSRGLGLVMSRMLIAQGARLAICARNDDELEQARNELEPLGEVLTVPCDVTNNVQVEQLVKTVHDRFGAIDVLINNAGTIQVAPMELMTLEDYDEALKTHFWAPLYTTLAVLPEMRQRHSGRIVNVSSIGGKVSVPHLLPYSASKFALVGLSEGMHAELAKDGIIVTTVCPGLIRTGSQHNAFFKGKHQEEYNWFSLSASWPFSSMSTESAARQIIAALKRGSAEVVLSIPAQIGDKVHGLFPGLTSALLGWVNRLLPEPGGIGTDRVQGKDSHSSLSPSSLTTLSDNAAIRNNEVTPKEVEGDQPHEPDTSPDQVHTDPAEVTACLADIQDTMGIPWAPANWKSYARYPAVMQLFWQRLKPAVATESFLRHSIAISELALTNLHEWYQPIDSVALDESEKRHLQRELNAFVYGNPQLLIQQVILSRALRGELVGEAGRTEPRRGTGSYRHPEILMLDEQAVKDASIDLQRAYDDIKQTLGVPVVNSDYQAMARSSAFFLKSWEEIKHQRLRPDYQELEQTLMQRAEEAVDRLHPAIGVGEQEVRDLLDNADDFETLRDTVDTFTRLLPGLLINNAIFLKEIAAAQPNLPASRG